MNIYINDNMKEASVNYTTRNIETILKHRAHRKMNYFINIEDNVSVLN